MKGALSNGIDGQALLAFAKELQALQKKKFQIGVVIGGGNIWRYRDNKAMELDRVTSDTIGMLATVMNALALEAALKKLGAEVRAMSSFAADKALENYVPKRARHHLDKGKIVIFAGGTGSPFFTTDSAAALRALETKCDVVLKATKVDYVYDKDPLKYKNAKKIEKLTFDEVVDRNLEVMDMTCASLLKGKKIPMVVFNMHKKGNLFKAASGKKIGTIIR